MIHADEREPREDFALAPTTLLAEAIVVEDGAPANLRTITRDLLFVASQIEPVEGGTNPRMLGGGELDREQARYSYEGAHVAWISLWCDGVLLGKARVVEPGGGPDLVVDLARIPPPAPRATLAVEVVDGESGEPVVEYELRVIRHALESVGDGEATREFKRTGGTDAGASAEFHGLSLGRYEIEVRAAGYAPRLVALHHDATAGAAPRRIALCRPISSIAGHVVDAQGISVSGAMVDLLQPNGEVALPFPDYQTLTNVEGAFEFPFVATGDYLVNAHVETRAAPDAPALAPAIVAASAGKSDVHLVLPPSLHVTVDVHFPSGIVSFFLPLVRDESDRPLLDFRPGSASGWCIGTRTELRLAAGAYTIELLAPNHRCDPIRFVAVDDGTVTVEMVNKEGRR
ncbi:MAG: carboxypeptidase regulatory-like domain-containing protein [Planctomycetes bacterium]|nr:carboxypeptidase regulatory-like domain-containing protein [Planctomycetota bacterium]